MMTDTASEAPPSPPLSQNRILSGTAGPFMVSLPAMDAQRAAMAPRTGKPELIVIFDSVANVRTTSGGLTSSTMDVSSLQDVLRTSGASIKLLFGPSEERVRSQTLATSASALKAGENLPDMASFYRVIAPEEKLHDLSQQLRAQKHVKAAYVKPGFAPAIFAQPPAVKQGDAAPVTPNFQSRQTYLDPAPNGIDAQYAHWMVGGQGERMRVCSLEWGWLWSHEDLMENQSGVFCGSFNNNDDHGTATIGIISGDKNPYGIMGIAPRADACASSLGDQGLSEAIKNAADKMNPGDFIYMSIHGWGPKSNGYGQYGYIAVEWWPDVWLAIKYATMKGIVVVEAAGNGSQDLDDPIYDTARTQYGFPGEYPNPFNTNNPSCGAVMVGAGAPPPGTHGHDWWGPDRSRLWYSNYGSRVDCQSQGYDVTTTGYGDLQGGGRQELWYTDSFSGTSSATPIVCGALAAMQGVLKDFGRRPVRGEECRHLVRTTGSAQQDGYQGPKEGQRIGNRPNLRQLIPAALKMTEWRGMAKI